MLIRMLLAAEPAAMRRRLERLLVPHEVLVLPIPARARLLDSLRGEEVDAVLVGRSVLPTPPGERIAMIRELPERPEIIVVTEREDPDERAALVAAGCMGVLSRGLSDVALGEALGALVQRLREEGIRRLGAERSSQAARLDDFVSSSTAMRNFLALARRVVPTSSTLLILGETGVGKERLARALHNEGPRSAGPFMALNGGAIPDGLLESELFGHEQGAFTGATRARRGYFELAHRGTLFLDEIGEMPPQVQVKLLRILEDRALQRVGGERLVHVDVRVMAATNRDLEQLVRERRFRQDLYYRLAVVTLALPPLRDRREDIAQLAEDYLARNRARLGRQVERIDSEAMDALVRYDWPGNVRELINVIERAVLLCNGNEIGIGDLPRAIAGPAAHPAAAQGPARDDGVTPADGWHGKPLRQARREAMAAFERSYLDWLLEESRGSIGKAARRAGINERSLYELVRRHGLRKEDYRG